MSTDSKKGQAVQLDLFFDRFAALARRLEALCGVPLNVRFHRNRWTYVSCDNEPRQGRLCVRIHECFVDATDAVVEALAVMIHGDDPVARRTIQEFVNTQSEIWDEISEEQARPARLNSAGRVYDLQPLFDELNRRYFGDRCRAQITWGKRSRKRQRSRQITLGSYEETSGIIRIHPVLDQRRVPKYFLRYIIYHEMLHTVIPSPESPTGKRLHHSRLFRQRERMFEEFERARAWERRFLGEEG